jgi:hypothetical protein
MYRERDGVISPTWLAYALSFSLFALLLAIGYLTIFIIWREALLSVLAAVMQGRHWSISRLLYMLSIVSLAVGGFVFLMAAEPYLRTGVERRDLRRRFMKLFIPLAALAVIGMAVRLVM